MIPSNLSFFLALLFVLSYSMVVMSVGAGNNVTVKMTRCRDNERRALLNFKQGLSEYGQIVSSWGKGKEEDCCRWRGIHCSKHTGHVTLLDIRGSDNYYSFAVGKVSPSLLELSHLKYLDLSINDFDSNIPDFLGSLTTLQYLNLSHAFFNGDKVPHQLGNLTNLRHLDLGFSAMKVDNLDWLSHLHFLRYLDLSWIDLSQSSDWLQKIFKLPFLRELHLFDCHLPVPLLPITNSSSSLIPLVVVDLSYNYFIYPSAYNWLFNFSSSLVQIDMSGCSLNGSIPEAFGSMVSLENLSLRFNNFIGLLPESFRNLSHLHTIDLENNNFNGSSLETFGSMMSLENLYLNDCLLEGELPDSFRNLSRLHTLNLESNNFSGSIPEAFGSMVSLENLSLKTNHLIGDLPESFQNLSHLDTLDLEYNNFDGQLNEFLRPLVGNQKNSLRVLSLGRNQLGGTLPDFTRFPYLREIAIFENKINGSFPENFAQVSDLVSLDVSSNQITGLFPNLTLFSSLEELLLKSNQLEDTITEANFSNLTKLYFLDLSSNRLTFKFRSEWVPPFKLEYIYLRKCNLGPHFPNWLQSQRSIYALDISCVGISDTIPLWFWDLSPGLRVLNISNNQIEGILPDLSLKLAGSVIIDVSSNNLTGHIPLFNNNVRVLILSRNMFTGSLSFLRTTGLENLSTLDLSDNQLSGELPDCWMNVYGLEYLNLANNNLSGKLPPSIGLLNPTIILLRNNNLRGELPSSLKNYKNTRVLDLSENELSGEVPTWIGTHLTSLVVFSVHKNQFSGSIPPHICHLSHAQVLDLSQNNISGSIPLCFNNLASLITSETLQSMNDLSWYGVLDYGYRFRHTLISVKGMVNAFVQWKGVKSEYRRTLGLLKMIDLSSNKLVGRIPNEFSYLEGLISLNLSRNKLSGNIIQNIGKMKRLEILDLSQNLLTGEIPSGLASLTFLSVLNLSNNNLWGKIPPGTQLQTFEASAYAGNDKLCGRPLSNLCPGEETNVLPPTPVGHGSDKHNEVGLYGSVVCGFATGFWGLIGPILLRRTWRDAYFRMLQKIYDWIYLTVAVNMARLQRKIQG